MCDNSLGDLALGVKCPEEQRFAPTLANDPLIFNKPFSERDSKTNEKLERIPLGFLLKSLSGSRAVQN